MSDLRCAFPEKSITEPKQIKIHNWSTDPYAQGAYPFWTPYTKEAHLAALATNHGNVHFAGSDTSQYGYSIHHGYATGLRVAEEIDVTLKSGYDAKLS
jgi:monoamine oxidase